MSLYTVQKLIYEANRNADIMRQFKTDRAALLDRYAFTLEERGALEKEDVGLLYVLGVNGQLLMHFAAACGLAWGPYLEAMVEGVKIHGPVRAGVYAIKDKGENK